MTAANQPQSKTKPLSAKSAAHRQKRLAKLNEMRAKDVVKFKCTINEREARDLGIAKDWKSFCEMKAAAFNSLWLGKATQKHSGGASIEKKKAKMEKLKAMLLELEKELA